MAAGREPARRRRRGLGFRYRDQLWPIWWGLGLLVARVVGGGRLHTGRGGAGVPAGAAVVVFWVRRTLDRRREWAYALVCLTAVAGARLPLLRTNATVNQLLDRHFPHADHAAQLAEHVGSARQHQRITTFLAAAAV